MRTNKLLPNGIIVNTNEASSRWNIYKVDASLAKGARVISTYLRWKSSNRNSTFLEIYSEKRRSKRSRRVVGFPRISRTDFGAAREENESRIGNGRTR